MKKIISILIILLFAEFYLVDVHAHAHCKQPSKVSDVIYQPELKRIVAIYFDRKPPLYYGGKKLKYYVFTGRKYIAYYE